MFTKKKKKTKKKNEKKNSKTCGISVLSSHLFSVVIIYYSILRLFEFISFNDLLNLRHEFLFHRSRNFYQKQPDYCKPVIDYFKEIFLQYLF